jgi:HSP20 family molecular chaperone IbpA
MESEVINIVSQEYDEETNSLLVEVPMPHARKDTIDLQVHYDGFTLRALRDDEEEGEYIAAFSLCCPVNQENVNARFEDGVLNVSFPIHESVDKPVTVKID